jgi:hypothetical protein
MPLTDPDAERLRGLFPDLWVSPKTSCLTCDMKKSFLTRFKGQVVTMDCDCLAQWQLNRWLLNAGIRLAYQRLSWDDATSVPYDVQHQVLAYDTHIKRRVRSGHGLVLWSHTGGTGKTMMVTLLLKKLLAEGMDGYFVQFNEMLSKFSAGWRSEEERGWFIRRVQNAGVLVVDDVGKEQKGKLEMPTSTFDMVIRARVANAQPTIITTNYTPEEIRQGYGEYVLSLLSEVNEYIEVTGADFRQTQKTLVYKDSNRDIIKPIVIE